MRLSSPISYVLVLLAAAVLYVATCAPGPLWQDSGMFQYRIWHGDLNGGLGLALAHPLYILIGMAAKAVPVGGYAYRINLISAIAAAVAVANVFLLVRLWLGRAVPALLAAVSLALSWTFWQHACIAEVYTLYAAWLTTEWLILWMFTRSRRARWLILLGLVNGLSVATHMWGVIPLAFYGVFLLFAGWRKHVRFAVLPGFMLAWILGALPYLGLVAAHAIQSGDLGATLRSACFGDKWASAVLNMQLSARVLGENLLFIAYSFPTPNLLLAAVGAWWLWRDRSPYRPGRWLLAVGLLFLAFAFRYIVPDRYAFFLPFYAACAVWMGFGADRLLASVSDNVKGAATVGLLGLALLPIAVYAVAPSIARHMEVDLGTRRTIPFRDDYAYFLQPWQCGNHGPAQFAAAALTDLPTDAIVLADGTTVYALWYAQAVEGLRADVRIVSSHGDYRSPLPEPDAATLQHWLSETGVYVVSPVLGYCPAFLLGKEYDLEPAGPLYRITLRGTPGTERTEG